VTPWPAPSTGHELLGWLYRRDGGERGTWHDRAARLAAARGYPSRVLDWDRDQVADVWHELLQKPAKGSVSWGGQVAGSDHVVAP
jgi:hypothetical protein